MPNTDWKPVNPCDECSIKGQFTECMCDESSDYSVAVEVQKELLKYLIKEAKQTVVYFDDGVIHYGLIVEQLKSMLKELEVK